MNKKLPFIQRRLRQHALGRSAPAISASLGFGAGTSDDYYLSLPFRRSLPVILISAAFLIIFCFPLFAMSGMLEGSSEDSLSSLVSILFAMAWLLGWSTGIAVLLIVFLCLSVGKESLHVVNNMLVLKIGIPGLALCGAYDAELIRNFRYEANNIEAGKKWRGTHIAFNYGNSVVGLGSDIDIHEAAKIISRLQALFPLHDAVPVELSTRSAAQSETVEEKAAEPKQQRTLSDESAKPVHWNSPSSILLILANLIPLLGVWVAGWDIGEIMLLFWAESAIIGYYNLCKMWKIGRWSLLFYGPFFVGHYGAFMAVHLMFIYALFGSEMAGGVDTTRLQVFNDLLALWPALLGLLISHGISYYINFVKANKGQDRKMASQMQEPYRRVMIMHMTLIFGGFLALALGSNVGALMLLLLLKIAADLRSHLSQHSA